MSETPGYVKNLKKESVVQSVINCLTDAMRNKELKPGDRIPPEPELAASMGVARSSVREAIKILSYLGVLESKRSEGTFVCSGFQESMIDPMIYGIIVVSLIGASPRRPRMLISRRAFLLLSGRQ